MFETLPEPSLNSTAQGPNPSHRQTFETDALLPGIATLEGPANVTRVPSMTGLSQFHTPLEAPDSAHCDYEV